MNRINICNWFLTRRCNLRCSYCAIVRNYKGKPVEYPDMKHYHENEMTTEDIIRTLGILKKHNNQIFNIFYGGEPFMRLDLPEIINYCNQEDIHYTIITNNSPEVQPMIEKLLNETDYVTGLTSSIDPVIFDASAEGDIVKKSIAGLKELTKYKNDIKDIVAEITVSNDNVKYLYRLVSELSELGINSDITFIDIAKSPYYDFSNVYDKDLLVHQSGLLSAQFEKIIENKLNVHMRDILLPKIWDILPSDMDCKNCKNITNITIDADGTLRLCIRIRGVYTPNNFNINNFMSEQGELNLGLNRSLYNDSKKYCRKCNWTCQLMSSITDKDTYRTKDLVHEDIRR